MTNYEITIKELESGKTRVITLELNEKKILDDREDSPFDYLESTIVSNTEYDGYGDKVDSRPDIITLAGLGDFSEDEGGLESLKATAEKWRVEFYPTYYDYELKGKLEDVEAVMEEAFSLPRDQWAENGLTEAAA